MIADNHSSHISIEIWEFVRENGLHLIIISSHTLHKLQSLDVSFFEPLKTDLAENVRLWHFQNVGKTLTSRKIAQVFGKVYASICRMELVEAGFSATEIVPCNPQIFKGEDFAGAESLMPVMNIGVEESGEVCTPPETPSTTSAGKTLAEITPMPALKHNK